MKELEATTYSATTSEEEYKFFVEAFDELSTEQIQMILDNWHLENRISTEERDVLKDLVDET